MLVDNTQGAVASTQSVGQYCLPQFQYDTVRHLLLGPLTAVQLTIMDLHSRHYAEPNDWSRPISTGRPNEVMAILTRKVRVG